MHGEGGGRKLEYCYGLALGEFLKTGSNHPPGDRGDEELPQGV